MAGIVLTIEVDDKGSVKVKQFSDKTKEAFDEMKKGPEQAKGSLNSVRDSWIGLTAKIAIATAAIYGFNRAINSFISDAAEAEEIENRLRFALETTGYTWQYAKSAVDQFANSIQEVTRFSDEQARQALIDMMMYTQDFSKAQEGAKLAMDMSVRTGMDLVTSARYIGMAMSGNVEMLGRYIPQLRNLDGVLGSNATMAEKAAYGWKVLREMFGGTAQAEIGTYSLKVAQMKNAWSDLKEMLGNDLIPVLKTTFEWITKIMKSWKGDELENLSRQLSQYQKWLEYGIKQGASPAFIEEYRKRIEETQKAIERLDVETAQKKLAAETKPDVLIDKKKEIDTIKETITAYEALVRTASEYGEIVMARQELVELGWSKQEDIIDQVRAELERLEREANEWGEVTVARQELVEAGWAKAAKSQEEIKRIYTTFSENISSVWASNMVNIVKSTESTSIKIKSFFQSIGDVFISTVSKMITQWLLFGSITGKQEDKGGFFYGGSWGGILGGIASLFKPAQEGGIFTRPTPVIAGDAGDEAFIPLKGGKIPIEGKSGGDTFILVLPHNYDKSFVDMVKRNPEAIVETVHKDARSRGVTRSDMKRYG